MAHLHPIYDTDPHFSIDPTTRNITYESEDKLVIVQGDHNSQRYTFELPRYIDGHDMKLCDLVQVHYINIENGGRGRSVGVYEVNDMQTSADDENVIVLSWLVSQNATLNVGSLNFVLHFACTSGSKIDYAWNTTVYSSISIIASIDNAELIVDQYADVLEQWYMELLVAGTSSVESVYTARDSAIETVSQAKENAINGASGIMETLGEAIIEINGAKDVACSTIGEAQFQADTIINNTKEEALESIRNAKSEAIDNQVEELIDEIMARIPYYNGEVV